MYLSTNNAINFINSIIYISNCLRIISYRLTTILIIYALKLKADLDNLLTFAYFWSHKTTSILSKDYIIWTFDFLMYYIFIMYLCCRITMATAQLNRARTVKKIEKPLPLKLNQRNSTVDGRITTGKSYHVYSPLS